jgi:hypothetical protein
MFLLQRNIVLRRPVDAISSAATVLRDLAATPQELELWWDPDVADSDADEGAVDAADNLSCNASRFQVKVPVNVGMRVMRLDGCFHVDRKLLTLPCDSCGFHREMCLSCLVPCVNCASVSVRGNPLLDIHAVASPGAEPDCSAAAMPSLPSVPVFQEFQEPRITLAPTLRPPVRPSFVSQAASGVSAGADADAMPINPEAEVDVPMRPAAVADNTSERPEKPQSVTVQSEPEEQTEIAAEAERTSVERMQLDADGPELKPEPAREAAEQADELAGYADDMPIARRGTGSSRRARRGRGRKPVGVRGRGRAAEQPRKQLTAQRSVSSPVPPSTIGDESDAATAAVDGSNVKSQDDSAERRRPLPDDPKREAFANLVEIARKSETRDCPPGDPLILLSTLQGTPETISKWPVQMQLQPDVLMFAYDSTRGHEDAAKFAHYLTTREPGDSAPWSLMNRWATTVTCFARWVCGISSEPAMDTRLDFIPMLADEPSTDPKGVLDANSLIREQFGRCAGLRQDLLGRKEVASFLSGGFIVADYYSKLMPACAPYCVFAGPWSMRGHVVSNSPWECVAEVRCLLPRTDNGKLPRRFTLLHVVHDADHYAYVAVRVDSSHPNGFFCVIGDSLADDGIWFRQRWPAVLARLNILVHAVVIHFDLPRVASCDVFLD